MKRIVTYLVGIITLCMLPVVATAVSTPISLFLNGNQILNEPVPRIVDNYAYIELHTFARELDVEVDWDSTAKKATLRRANTTIELTVNQSYAIVNQRQIDLIAQPFMSGDYIYLPMQFVGEQLGIKTNWDELTQSLMLYQKDKSFVNSVGTGQLGGVGQNPPIPNGGMSGQLSLLTSIQVINNEVRLRMDKLTESTSFYLTNPERFVVDLPASQLDVRLLTNIEKLSGELTVNHPIITKIRYAMNDKTTVRVVLELAGKASFKLSGHKNTNELIISPIGKVFKVVIDPGHGGKDPGADGASGEHEKHFTLDMSLKIQKLLENEPSIQSYMTRTGDSFLSLDDRIHYANNMKADLFISIHGNTFTSPISGTETYYWLDSSKAFANVMHDYVLAGTKLPDRSVRKTEYRVLRDAKMPAVLLEIGYLSNAAEEKIMLTNEFQDRVAAEIVNGIKKFLGVN